MNHKKIICLLLSYFCCAYFFCISATGISCINNIKPFVVSPSTIKVTKYFYKNLNKSPLFNIENILDSKNMRRNLTDKFIGNGKIVKIKTEDNQTIESIFFDRNSDKIVFIVPGFGNELEKLGPFVHIFDKYDVVICSLRGHGSNQPRLNDISQWPTRPSKKIENIINKLTNFINPKRIPRVNLRKTTFGQEEENDLFAIVTHFKNVKHYEKAFFLGGCFGAHVGAKLAAKHNNIFDKLILDSALDSPKNIIDRVIKSPELIIDPQRKSLSSCIEEKDKNKKNNILSWIKNKFVIKKISGLLKKSFSKISIPNKTTGECLSEIKVPILFFHGKDDKMTPYKKDFIKNWDNTKTKQKAAIIFENSRHLINHIKFKEVYTCASKLFFELPYEEFINLLNDPKKLVQYKVNEIKNETDNLTKSWGCL